jgi:excisionase family DNA binding protein
VPERESWVSVDVVANHVGIAKNTVYRWIESKGLPAHRIGRLWKFKLSEMDEWVRAGGADTNESRSIESTNKQSSPRGV